MITTDCLGTGIWVKEAGTNEPVTTSTLFEAQSISKAVAATATLALVNSGRLSLDDSPNVYLKSWKLPYNEYQAHEKVTYAQNSQPQLGAECWWLLQGIDPVSAANSLADPER